MKRIIYSVLVALTIQGSASAFFFFKRSAPKPVPPVSVAPVAPPVMPVQQISPAELTHIQNAGEALTAVRNRDISSLIYYLEAGLLRPSDYKFLLQEANLAVARQSKRWRSLWSWMKLIGGVAGGMLFLYGLYDALRMPEEEQDKESEKAIKQEIEEYNETLNGVPYAKRHNVRAGVRSAFAWNWYEGLYEKRDDARDAKKNNKRNMENYSRGGSWGYNKSSKKFYKGLYLAKKAKLHDLRDEILETERKRNDLEAVLANPKAEKSQEEFLSRRWSIEQYGGYLFGAAVSFFIGYSGLVAPGKAYQEAKDIVELLKKYQREACPPKPEVAEVTAAVAG